MISFRRLILILTRFQTLSHSPFAFRTLLTNFFFACERIHNCSFNPFMRATLLYDGIKSKQLLNDNDNFAWNGRLETTRDLAAIRHRAVRRVARTLPAQSSSSICSQ